MISVPSAIHNCEVEYNNNRNAIIHCSLKRVLENMTVRAEFYTPTRKDDYGGHKEGRPNASVMDIEILFDELIYDSDYEAYVVCEIGQTKHGQQIVKFSTKGKESYDISQNFSRHLIIDPPVNTFASCDYMHYVGLLRFYATTGFSGNLIEIPQPNRSSTDPHFRCSFRKKNSRHHMLEQRRNLVRYVTT